MTDDLKVFDYAVCCMNAFPGAVKKMKRHGLSPSRRAQQTIFSLPNSRKRATYVLQFGSWQIDRRAMWF